MSLELPGVHYCNPIFHHSMFSMYNLILLYKLLTFVMLSSSVMLLVILYSHNLKSINDKYICTMTIFIGLQGLKLFECSQYFQANKSMVDLRT